MSLKREKLEREKEINEHERLKNEHELAMKRERQATERAKIAQESETARTVADSQPASPASSQGSSNSSPNIPFDHFDEKSESTFIAFPYTSNCTSKKTLVNPEDYTGETTQIQTVDLDSPPKNLPMALINVESRYVRGRIKAIVMKAPAYDLILGCRYVFLGTPPYPGLSALVVTRSQAPEEGTDSIEANPLPTEMREA
ncbi:hypothetical protein Bpfe_002732 [Biomphalaria pfeifferi]|uniref:Uncharacterized protein n=1 Tax=Biomphalaria pfeifferi TaxID=112525 RepID=A0AAD8C7M2_BIOPF|nr:hypothetical protein Bpfe_002732 [Biomphalaria pfeifferi]